MTSYNTHLCTFMGREENLLILIPYIEKALEINAIDNYWFVDMTRTRSDHQLISREYTRLSEIYPGRVHIHNNVERGKIIDDPEAIKEASNDWSVFYRLLENFNDDDIIAKCDDDTYYIDVETLKAAFELRWRHQQPYILHANTINNGVAAYHQNKENIWDNKTELDRYPIGGLTGPLFSFPEIACDHHKQFSQDMLQDITNIKKYKLHKNIHFSNRVSINFMFMLGKDRHTLKDITRQDEYDVSCKYPQREDRPNMIIGDFTVAHHTYGVQEPVMDRRQTRDAYLALSKLLNNREYKHNTINMDFNPVSTIKDIDNIYLCKAWVQPNSYCLRDSDTGLFISLDDIEVNNKNGTFTKSRWSTTSDFKSACILNIDNTKDNCIWINNSIQLIRYPNHLDKPQESAMMGFTFFQGLYKKCKMKVNIQDNKCVISPERHPEYFLSARIAGSNIPLDHKSRKQLLWKKDNQFTWDMIPLGKYHDSVIPATITRPEEFLKHTNDNTTAQSQLDILPNNSAPKDYIWVVKDYIWEFVKLKNGNLNIKLIADDRSDTYMCRLDSGNIGTGGPDQWTIESGDRIKHITTGLFIDTSNKEEPVTLSTRGSKLCFNFNSSNT